MSSTSLWNRRRALAFGVPIAALVLGLVVVVMGRARSDTEAALVTSDDTRITRVDLRASVSPGTIYEGDDLAISYLMAIRGGPGPVTIAAKVPRGDGGTVDVGFTLMLERDAVYGFDMPVPGNFSPGTHNIVVRAQSFHNSRIGITQVIPLTIRARVEP